MDLPYYHGPLSKRDCETLLLKEEVDGNFLLRDSESVPGALCLCVSFEKMVYTYRIFREKNGYYKIQCILRGILDSSLIPRAIVSRIWTNQRCIQSSYHADMGRHFTEAGTRSL